MAAKSQAYKDDVGPEQGSPFRPLYDERIRFSGQPIALVVAEEWEIARFAATLVRVEYKKEKSNTDLQAERDHAFTVEKPEKPRGNAGKAFAAAAVRHEAEYFIPRENHNPMELFASTAVWEGDGKLTVYDKTQGVQNVQRYLCSVFALKPDRLRVMSPFMGGGFGSGLRPQYQAVLAVLAALRAATLGSPGADPSSKCTSSAIARPRSNVWRWAQARAARSMRSCMRRSRPLRNTKSFPATTPAGRACSTKARMRNICTDWRGSICRHPPTCGRPARRRGYSASNAQWTSLRSRSSSIRSSCGYAVIRTAISTRTSPTPARNCANATGKARRRSAGTSASAEPRSMRDGSELVGWGMATGVWEALQMEFATRIVLTANGHAEVACAASDIGTGTYTIMAQVTADMLGLPLDNVTVKLGDSTLPLAQVAGGSWTAASVANAIARTTEAVRKELLRLAKKLPDSPLASVKLDDTALVDGEIVSKTKPERAVSIADAMSYSGLDRVERESTSDFKELKSYACNTHSAVFAEVKVDEELGVIRVTRVVDAVAAGRILNTKTAHSQIMGAVVWGIGMALHEEALIDHAFGRVMNANIAEYHVPVNADVHDIDVIFVDEPDDIINPLGIKGVGEIGIVGVASAIANAVYHATGKRVRDLPITLDKLLR